MTEVFYSQWYSKALVAQREERHQDALKALEEGSKNDCGMCCWWLGECFAYNVWADGDNFKDKILLEKAISLGNHRARRMLRDWSDISELNTKDWFAAGLFCWWCTNNDDAVSFFAKAADEENDCFAQWMLARLYASIYKKPQEGLRYGLLSAKQGYFMGQYDTGLLFTEYGNYNEAVYWLRKSAEQGYYEAQYILGKIFIEKFTNAAASTYWLQKAMHSAKTVRKEDRVFTVTVKNKAAFEKSRACRDTTFTLIAIRKFRGALACLPKDVVVLLAKYLWKTRDDWSVPPQGVKKLKTKYK